jgi:hypothetical protein
MLRPAVALIALAAALLGAGETSSATPTPNVRGVLMRGPHTLVCPADEPCDPPPFGVYVVFTRGTRVVTRVRVGPSGAFATYLPPARYGIRLAPPTMARIVPATVLVVRGKVAILRLRVLATP